MTIYNRSCATSVSALYRNEEAHSCSSEETGAAASSSGRNVLGASMVTGASRSRMLGSFVMAAGRLVGTLADPVASQELYRCTAEALRAMHWNCGSYAIVQNAFKYPES